MKKMILSLIALLAAMSTSAQVVEIYQNGNLVNAYLNTNKFAYKVVFKGQSQSGDAVTAGATEAQEIEVSMNGTVVKTYQGTAENPYKVVFKSTGELATTGIINGHSYVKIGKILWSTMNVGATSATGKSTESFGDYYAWGETVTYYQSFENVGEKDNDGNYYQPIYSSESVQSHCPGVKTGYTWQTYANVSKTSEFNNFSNWTAVPYGDDNTLTPENDVANVEWGGGWRMPTQEEVFALKMACEAQKPGTEGNEAYVIDTQHETTISKKGAYDVVAGSTIDGVTYQVAGVLWVADATDKSQRVFFPRAGRISGTNWNSKNTDTDQYDNATFWTSTWDASNCKAYSVNMITVPSLEGTKTSLYIGRSIRPVIVLDE